jgi:hypothetical protein
MFMPTLLFQVFERDDFNNAKDGSLLSGYIKMEDSQAKQCGVVQLGQEVEDLSTRYLESTTEFRSLFVARLVFQIQKILLACGKPLSFKNSLL